MKRHSAFWLAPTLLLALAAAGCEPQETADPPAPRPARVMEAVAQEIPLSAEGSGQIEARNTANVGFLVAGRMTSRNVDVGATVKTSDLLAQLDPTDMQNKLTAAQAAVKAAQGEVNQLAAEETAKAKLLEQGFTTQLEYNQVLKALTSAQANLESAVANQRLAEDQLKYTQLLAPVAGAVTETGAEAGNVVQAGQMIVQIADTSQLDGVFAISGRAASVAAKGMPIKVWLQADPSIVVVGSLREIAPNADPVTGTYQVRVTLPNPPPTMRLGGLIRGRGEIAGPALIRIPATALLQTGDQPMVWVVSAEGKVARRPVKVASYDTDSVVIAEGINTGELIVIAGVNSLAEGQVVTIQKVAAK